VVQSGAATQSLVGGVLALDFANSGSGRDTAEPVELLQAPADVVDWAVHAGGADAATAGEARAAIAADGDAAKILLRHARELREAVYATASAIARGGSPPQGGLRTLKDFARRAVGAAKLRLTSTGGYAFDCSEAEPEFALLGPVVWSALDLLAKGEFERVKECPECRWLFFDRSKNNSRRWCDMATCGNRIKLRRHRGRR
jgi:predicted RNA-binding Zn ribbon-like protein